MKLCKRGLNWSQPYDGDGNLRMCSWTKDGYLGSLLDCSFEELYHGDVAKKYIDRLSKGDYHECNVDDCPYLAQGTIEEMLVEIDEIPEYPTDLNLAFENTCNYNCETCNMHERMQKMDKKQLEESYDIIEKRLQPVLPHIKHLSANGQGELFACKRTMRLLQEWKPLAPKEECSVALETNGSLFDEEHWKQIENIGQYHLTVAITVMSFDEYAYQLLSGTKLPIARIESNLMFVKSLREKGIINHLEIATVVQERNFRTLPEFTRRCIEEFGADSVRLRSFVPWGKRPLEQEWFTDIRNPFHPYYQEYLDVMKDPIFKHPAVQDWSGGKGTHLGEHPYKKQMDLNYKKEQAIYELLMCPETVCNRISSHMSEKKLVIYGVGDVGKALYKQIEENGQYKVAYFIDEFCSCKQLNEIAIYTMDELQSLDKNVMVVITPMGDVNVIENELQVRGFARENMIRLETILEKCCEEK